MSQLDLDDAERRIAELELALEEREKQFQQLQLHHDYLQREFHQHHVALKRIYQSEGWRLLTLLYRIRDRVLPARARPWLRRCKNFVRDRLSGSAASWLGPETLYRRWIAVNEPNRAELQRQRQHRFPWAPMVSVVVPVFNTPKPFLAAMIESLTAQTHANWELCLADGGSTAAHVWPMLKKYAGRDPRIHIRRLDHNEGIAGNSNAAIAMAQGEFVGFLDHDDVLAPFALHEIVAVANAHSDADMIYSDEDKLDEYGHRCDPHFKPDWSPESACAANYVCHFLVLRRSLLTELGGIRAGFDGAQDHDLVLRAGQQARRVIHIPKVLYHWRKHAASTATEAGAKPYACDSGRRAVAEHLQRQDIDAVVFSREVPGCYGARFLLGRKPLVSILIPNRDQPDMLARCMRALARSTYQPLEILIIENGSKEPQTHELYATWQAQGRCRVLNWDKPFHFAAMNNFAAAEARGEFLLLLNNDVEALNADWLEFMVGYARQPAIGAVGAKLLFPDGRLQHGGLVLGLNGSAGHIGHGHFPDDPNLNLRMTFARNCAAVTGACLLVRKAVFEEVGGLHEQFPFDFNDTDFCLKLLDRGYRNVWTPDACLLHHESKSRGNSMSPKKRARYRRDTGAFLAKWQQRIRAGDPYFSPHYRLDQPIYVLRVDKRAKDETANFANIEQAKEPERS